MASADKSSSRARSAATNSPSSTQGRSLNTAPSTTVIFPYTEDAVGDPLVVQPLEFTDRHIRFLHAEPLEMGARYLLSSRSGAPGMFTWFLYTVVECKPAGAMFAITARFTTVMQQTLKPAV